MLFKCLTIAILVILSMILLISLLSIFVNDVGVFYSNSIIYEHAYKKWIEFKNSMESKNYKIDLLNISVSQDNGYIFYYTIKEIK